jgi:hypothetical protein
VAIDRLSELDELLRRQLSARNMHGRIRDFLQSRGIKVGNGWVRIGAAIREHADDAGFLDALEAVVWDSVLVSQKRVYLLTRSDINGSQLVPPLPGDWRKDFLSAGAPAVSDFLPSFFLETRMLGPATVHTFVTSRPVNKTEEVPPSSLSEEGRQQYPEARIVARSEVNLRCYDHLVTIGDLALLLLDCPEGVDAGELSRAEVNYWTLIHEQLKVSTDIQIFHDFFPAVESLWRDSSEGIVNNLEFVSNNRAQIRGKFSVNSMENYRNHKFQKGGEASGAQVVPYRIAVKWPDRPGQPVAVLPGKASMVLGAAALEEGTKQGPLNFMELPQYTSWDDFNYVLDRVRRHLTP